MVSKLCNRIFSKVIHDYHVHDSIYQIMQTKIKRDSFVYTLYLKCWIDNVQWHTEDLIRDPDIDPIKGMNLKRRIDILNQERTNVVELIDDHFLNKYKNVICKNNAKVNSESPGWIIDRLSILSIKIFHMTEETNRRSASSEHRNSCESKLGILHNQKEDLAKSLDEFLEDIQHGHRYMKVYRQMKMYNDPLLNPVLYKDQ